MAGCARNDHHVMLQLKPFVMKSTIQQSRKSETEQIFIDPDGHGHRIFERRDGAKPKCQRPQHRGDHG